ncbi:hypothetical protein [Actinomycetospora soli]|uniref:hypothetical protein n=1 Tax=Actinomycetospora soli TaxID=2893887 RepID=UPI001E54E103|nr:hypothetical protein [Actinomycetospora soli]MCD2191288.1 hypothetical protein [Actinomycetospora soli]
MILTSRSASDGESSRTNTPAGRAIATTSGDSLPNPKILIKGSYRDNVACRSTRCADRFIITLCHGPAALLAVGLDRDTSPLTGYESCAFPDALDTGANLDLGYIPGPMPWLLAEGLRAQGLVVVNEDMAGHVHRDRGLLTGESPLAADALGKLAATTLVEATKS